MLESQCDFRELSSAAKFISEVRAGHPIYRLVTFSVGSPHVLAGPHLDTIYKAEVHINITFNNK